MIRRSVLGLVCVALVAASCGDPAGSGGDATTTTTQPPTTSIPMPPAEPVDPGTAADLPDGTPAVVQGSFVDDAGTVRLCSALAESYPPQCGGPAIPVNGLSRSDIVGVTVTGEPGLADVAWTDFLVTVEGVVRGGALEAVAVRQEVASVESGAWRVRLSIEPTPLLPNGFVAFALDVTNIGTEPAEVVFTSGQDADVRIFDADGDSLYTWSAAMSFIQVERPLAFEPGVPYGAVLNDALTLPAGVYTVEAGFVAPDLADILVTTALTIS